MSSKSDGASKFYDSSDDNTKQKYSLRQELKKIRPFSGESHNINFKGLDPRKRFDSTNSLDGTLEDADKTIIENGDRSQSSNDSAIENNQPVSPSVLMKPPPLPPKPKGLQRTSAVKKQILPSKPLPMTPTISNVFSPESQENNNNIF